MGYKRSQKTAEREIRIQKAIAALQNQEFSTPNAAATHFQVNPKTLRKRLAGLNSRAQARESQQILTIAEEKTLVRWIKCYSIGGNAISSSLMLELAQTIIKSRVWHASSSYIAPPIGHEWIYRFIGRNPTIQLIWSRQMAAQRFDGATYDIVKSWFDAIAGKILEHKYELQNMWNMDESGFGIGDSQSTKIIVPIGKQHKNKKIVGKQELVTDIECINAAGEALPPTIIFKAKNVNANWLPSERPQGWRYTYSTNGWTSNEIGLEWLRTVFEPLTRPKANVGPSVDDLNQRLLIVDGHGSHIRADFIAYCMENKIDLLVMPAHCSHILQPLDVGMFSSFKAAHSGETDAYSRLSSDRIPRQEWIQMFSRARAKAVTPENIRAGWRGAGIVPSDPMKVLERLAREPSSSTRPPRTPPDQNTLDTTLLQSSLPEGVELRQSNAAFRTALRGSNDIISPVYRYAERMTRLCEIQNSTIAIQAKQIAEQSALLNSRKKHKRGKRVRLEGIRVYSDEQVVQIAREEESNKKPAGPKRPRGRPRKRPIEELVTESEAESLISLSSESELEIEECVGRRTRSRME